MNEQLQQLMAKIEELNSQSESLVAKIEAGTATSEEGKALVEEIKPQVETLTAEYTRAMEQKALAETQAELTTLKDVIADLRKPGAGFKLGSSEENEGKAVGDEDPYRETATAFINAEAEGKSLLDSGAFSATPGKRKDKHRSFFMDVKLAAKGDASARERVNYGLEGEDYEGKSLNAEGKAMTEGTNAQGGYLVRPQIERQLVIAREQDNVLRGLCSTLNITTNQIQLDQLGISTVAGWVAELASKPETTAMTLASITANVFTAAGLATISNQLLADSNPAVDGLVTADLAKRLVALEETAFLNGTGSGQPLGILQTSGLGATALTATDVLSLLDAILDSITAVETSHGSPSAILMHPRTWTRILKSRDAQGAFYIDPTGGPQDARTGLRGPQKVLWGYPVVTTNRMPINLGTGTNESRVIVGDFKEALILDRQGITVDESPHVFFTTNQTVFRAEQRVGFTAARTPSAFNIVGGSGLANG